MGKTSVSLARRVSTSLGTVGESPRKEVGTELAVYEPEDAPETRDEYIRRLERENERLRARVALIEAEAVASVAERETRIRQLMKADAQYADKACQLRQQREDAENRARRAEDRAIQAEASERRARQAQAT